MRWRLIKWFFRLVVTLAIVGAVAGVWLFWRAMPSYSGTETLPGLTADVRVWRDAYAVPHIFAANMDDAARALGYLHASERLFQMEVSRRVGQGRAAETFGPDLLKVDKFIRALGFYREAEASFAALSPEAQKRLQAYADGVNAFLDTHKDALPPEFLLVGVTPEPWKPAELDRLDETDGARTVAQPRAGGFARRDRPKARAGQGRLVLPGHEAQRSDHD